MRKANLEVDLREEVHTNQLPGQPQDASGAAGDDIRRPDVNHLKTRPFRRRESCIQVLRGLVQT